MAKEGSLVPLKMLLFSFHATNTIILTFLPIYLKSKGLSGTEIGWVLAIGPLASIFSQPFWGYMSDKYKTVKNILLICVIGLLLSSIVFFQMNTLIAILFMGAVFYFFSTPIGGLGDSLAQRRANELNISFGTIRLWGSIGFATSALFIGELLDRIGVEYILWPYLFFGTIALIVILRIKDVTVASRPIRLKDINQLVLNKPYVIFLVLMAFITIAHRAYDSFIGLYITQLGGSERFVGIAWFVGLASEATIFATARYWFRKFHPLIFVIIAGVLYSIRWFLYGAVNDPLSIVFLQVFHGLTFGIFYLAALDYVTRLIPTILQATGHLVFYSVFFGVSGIIGSLMGGAIIDTYGGSTLYFLMGGFAFVGTVCLSIYYLGGAFKRDSENLADK